MTIHEIKRRVELEGSDPKFFSPSNLKFAGQRLRDFKTKKLKSGKILIQAPMIDRGEIKSYTTMVFNPSTDKLESLRSDESILTMYIPEKGYPLHRKLPNNPVYWETFISHFIRINELDLVVSTVPLENVPVGTSGTVVEVYDKKTFEVEFFQDGKTIGVLTVHKNQIKLPG